MRKTRRGRRASRKKRQTSPQHESPLTTPLAACLPESTLQFLDEVLSQPASQVYDPGAPHEIAGCEYVEGMWLCRRADYGHLTDGEHMRRVYSFLEARQVRRCRSLVRLYGAIALNTMALVVEAWEHDGVNWREGLNDPGAYLHVEIKFLSRRLGIAE